MSSSLLAAVASVTLLPGAADASLTLYTTEGDLVNDLTGAGGSLSFLEDFENHDAVGQFGYSTLASPLDGNPNGVFTAGINPGLSVTASFGSLSVSAPSPYTGNITSSVVGALSGYATTTLSFTGADIHGVGFDAWGIGSFIASAMQDFDYTIRDKDGMVIGSGNFPTPNAEFSGQFFGVSSTDAIGSIEIRGLAFGLDTSEYVDNVQAWSIVPAPGALAVFGLAGLMGTRRRRA